MARLETQLVRTFHQIEKMMSDGSDTSKITYFYQLIHCYERLNDRYIKAYGHSFNPCLERQGDEHVLHGEQVHD